MEEEGGKKKKHAGIVWKASWYATFIWFHIDNQAIWSPQNFCSMQVSLYIFLWLLFPSLTKHIDECSHWLIATPIACFTSVLSTLISVNIDQSQNISWCALTTALFDPSNVGWRDSRRVTGQIPAWTFNQSLILYWLDGWRYCNQTKNTWSPKNKCWKSTVIIFLLPFPS